MYRDYLPRSMMQGNEKFLKFHIVLVERFMADLKKFMGLAMPA